MDDQKISAILPKLNRLSESFEINEEFLKQLESSKIFPSDYIDYIRFSNTNSSIIKKNLLIDLTKRESTAYEKFSKILCNLFKCDLLNLYLNNYCKFVTYLIIFNSSIITYL